MATFNINSYQGFRVNGSNPRIHGNVYSSFIWKFTDPKDYLSFDEFLSESIDLEFMSLCVFFVFFGSCGMFLNGRRIYEFCRAKTSKNHYNLVILNIVLSDFLLSSVGIFMDIIGISLGANRRKWKLENSFCQLEGFFYMSTGMSALCGTVLISVIRLMIMKRGDRFWFQPSCPSVKGAFCSIMSFLLAMSFSVPPLVGYGKFDQSMVGVSCLPAWATERVFDAVYIWYVWIGGGLIPATIVLISNLCSILILRKDDRGGETVPSLLLENRRMMDTILMTLAFIVCWAPLGVLYCVPIQSIIKTEARRSNILPLLTVKFGCAIINPLVYVFENNEVETTDTLYAKKHLDNEKPKGAAFKIKSRRATL